MGRRGGRAVSAPGGQGRRRPTAAAAPAPACPALCIACAAAQQRHMLQEFACLLDCRRWPVAAAAASAGGGGAAATAAATVLHPRKSDIRDANFPTDAEGRTYHLGTKRGEVGAARLPSAGSCRRSRRQAPRSIQPTAHAVVCPEPATPPCTTTLHPPPPTPRWPTASCRWAARSGRWCWPSTCSRRPPGAACSCWRAAAASSQSRGGTWCAARGSTHTVFWPGSPCVALRPTELQCAAAGGACPRCHRMLPPRPAPTTAPPRRCRACLQGTPVSIVVTHMGLANADFVVRENRRVAALVAASHSRQPPAA